MSDPAARNSSTKRPARRVRRVAGGSLRAAWLLLRVAVVVGAVSIAVAWKAYGYTPVAVQTGSMTPTYPVHTLLFVHEVDVDSISKGDVITFDPPGPVPRTTHRVVEQAKHGGQWYFVTKGDANPAPDDWRRSDGSRPLGQGIHERGITYTSGTAPRTEFAIPHAGRLSSLSTVPHLRTILVAIPFLVIALQLLSWIWRRDDEDEDDECSADVAEPASGALAERPAA